MKRKIAAVLCFAMMAFSLIGCSQAELAYLDMGRQMSSESYKASGTVAGEINFDALAGLMQKTAAKIAEDNTYMYIPEDDIGAEFAAMGLEGTKKIKLHYTMLADMKNRMAFQIDLDAELDGKAYNLGDLYFDANEGIYLSKDLLMGFYDFYTDVFPNEWDSYFYTKEYREELLKSFGEREYVYAGYFDNMSPEERAEFDGMMDALNKDIYDEAYQFLTTTFSGFSTGAVSKISNGYAISLDGKQAKKLITDMLQYMIDNMGKIMSAYKEYSFKIIDAANLPEEEAAEAKASLETIFNPQMQIMAASGLASARQMFIGADQAGYLDFLNGFKYNASIRKQGNTFKQQEEMYLKDGRNTVFSLTSEVEATIQAVEIALPESIIFAEDVETAVAELENKYNPVDLVTISWWLGDPEAFIYYERLMESPFTDPYEMDIELYLIKEDRLYVPLRSISEKLGESVTWDAKARKAYVIRGDKQIDMTGILQDGRTYIKIRDFEKLGYKVGYEYDKEWEYHTATISR